MKNLSSPMKRPPLVPELHCSVDDQKRFLAASPYLRSLEPRQIARIQELIQQRHFTEGEVIYHQGTPASSLGIVAAGNVKLQRSTTEGRDVLLDILAPGDHFGSLAELGDDTYRETAVAQSSCCILLMDSRDFSRILIEYPAVARDALTIVAQRLNTAQSVIEQLSAYPVEHRIASALLHLGQRVGTEQNGSTLINVPLSRQDLADMVGTTVETASRVISDLRRAGAIESGRKWISIVDEAALRSRLT